MIIDSLKVIASKYGINEVVMVELGDELCIANGKETYINKSYICGNDRIELGIYENIDLMLASFFHELGHIVDCKDGYYNSEERAWEIGFQLAESYGIRFDNETHFWAKIQKHSYKEK